MRSVVERSLRAAPLLACLIIVLALVAGCGGGGSSSAGVAPTPTPTPTPGFTPTQIRIGDAAVDSIVDFEFSVGAPVVFTMSGAAGAVSITPGPNRLELSHMAAKMEPLDLLNVPPASYVSAQLTIQDPELTFLTAQGTPVTITGATQTVIIPLNPPLTIGSAATVVNLDVNIANSILESNGTITGFNFTPSSFAFTSKPVAAEAEQQDDSGEVEGLVGLVSAVNGTSFTLNLTSNSQLVFNTDSTTQYKDGLTSLASALNQLVQVEGISKPDGSLFAKELEGVESQSGSELDGLIMLVTGNPATSLTLLAQDGIGNGMDPAKIGQTFTADVSGLSASKYVVDQQKCDFSGLTVPSASLPFDPTTIHAGQRVEIENTAGVPAVNGSFTADRIKLEQQAISGTVSNVLVFSGSGGVQTRFDLTLPSDSHLAVLSGLPLPVVVHVIAQPGTDNKFGSITENTTGPVRVRGLLFWTGTTFNMIARRITQP
ncbi:MAG TPA: DUF5666 domain-containing protein [Candidatus Angelobacter sp.]|nr:DUF5666 domain-containing protein [Candidatus Angelobacter sp.]